VEQNICHPTYPELCHVQGDILVERIQDNLADPLVTPSAMHQEQFPKISELADSNICTSSSLETFHTADTHTNVSSLNHRYIVGAIANR
jgi:hypothetical protein